MSGDVDHTPPAEAAAEGEDEEDDDFDDLRDQINYNTITSLAALKEILGHDSRTSPEDVSWFQHYFLNHVTRLPSRSQYPGRRLSECPEEDETATDASATSDKSKQDHESSSSSSTTTAESSSSDDEDEEESKDDESKAESVTTKDESKDVSESSSAPPTPKRNPSLTPDTPPTSPSPRTLSRGTSPHFDKRFFDSSLIEMKSTASSSSTIDNDSTEEVWIRRVDADTVRRKRELGSQPLPTIVTEDHTMASHEPPRQRAGQ